MAMRVRERRRRRLRALAEAEAEAEAEAVVESDARNKWHLISAANGAELNSGPLTFARAPKCSYFSAVLCSVL